MAIEMNYSFQRYLLAKRTIDDRALNKNVWGALKENLEKKTGEKPVNVLEIGAGIGTMLARVVEWGLLRQGVYTAIDSSEDNIQEARRIYPLWTGDGKPRINASFAGEADTTNGLWLETRFEAIDLYDFIRRQQGNSAWDLIIAHAFLDLVDIDNTLPLLLRLAHPGSLFYFTINYDGMMVLEPAINPGLEEKIFALYHRTMDERITDGKRSGESRSGRHLFTSLKRAGLTILDAGSSDWVVHPLAGHNYPSDEAYFLHFILHTIETELGWREEIDEVQFQQWAAQRHDQIKRGELVYIAHQMDFLAVVPEP